MRCVKPQDLDSRQAATSTSRSRLPFPARRAIAVEGSKVILVVDRVAIADWAKARIIARRTSS